MALEKLPDCMLPDGGDPCKAYQELYDKYMDALIRIDHLETSRKNLIEHISFLTNER